MSYRVDTQWCLWDPQKAISYLWNDVQGFIQKLNQKEKNAQFALPSEVQWEYACRAGTSTRFYSGDADEDLGRVGWYDENAVGTTHPVGQKEPNAFGLYDMHGNVWEWVEDDWHDDYNGAPNLASAWIDEPRGSSRVLRGGSWILSAMDCRAACRYGPAPGYRYPYLGFRLALLPGQPG
jgi:formylglycine-generating enzyme required for sulfatase activity